MENHTSLQMVKKESRKETDSGRKLPITRKNDCNHARRCRRKLGQPKRTAKEDSWRELLTSAMNEDESKVWSLKKILKGCLETSLLNEALRRSPTPYSKKGFRKPTHSQATMPKQVTSIIKEERDVNRQHNLSINKPSSKEECHHLPTAESQPMACQA